jgi:glutamate synthase (NADPH/NADH) large chain
MTGGTAVILGKTGRNLGAGMSGGTAFVYKLRGDRINAEALAAGELHLLELDSENEAIVKALVEQHQSQTGSLLAARMLDDWQHTARDFTLILPRDYASVLQIRANATGAGIDPDGEETWARILEVTNG